MTDIDLCFVTNGTSWADMSDDENYKHENPWKKESSGNEQVKSEQVKSEQVKSEQINKNGWSVVVNKKKNKNEGVSIVCKICNKKFFFPKYESEYFESKGWEPRKKCKKCKSFQKSFNKN